MKFEFQMKSKKGIKETYLSTYILQKRNILWPSAKYDLVFIDCRLQTAKHFINERCR